jgi:PRC-barrel domain
MGSMLRSMKDLNGFTIGATDGDIGQVETWYFDDASFTVRHLVVDTSRWLVGRKVLISPRVLRDIDWEAREGGDPHLRSSAIVIGYHIAATDGEIGHVEDFLVDEATWAIRYMVVDTRNWWSGTKVLVSPGWVARVDWDASKVEVNMTREQIKNSPEYDPSGPVQRDYEARLHDHYGRPGYWAGPGTGSDRREGATVVRSPD